jgi:glycosyltransferase involved in cell wall biosynthesis
MYYDYSKFKELYKSYQNSKYIVSLVPLENDYVFKKWGIGSILMSNFVTYEQKKIIPSDLTENIILMIGRSNDNYKRLYLGIQTMEYITKEITRCKMIIISNVTNNYYLKNLVNDLILTKSVIFKGYSSIPEVYYKNISLHIFPTISESFGLVLSETKIYGIPNILIGLD